MKVKFPYITMSTVEKLHREVIDDYVSPRLNRAPFYSLVLISVEASVIE